MVEAPCSSFERSAHPRPSLRSEDFIRIPLPGFVDFAGRSCWLPSVTGDGPGSEREHLPTWGSLLNLQRRMGYRLSPVRPGTNYTASERVSDSQKRAAVKDDSERGPGWVTVIVVVATLAFIALPRTIALSGLSPILFVVDAFVLVFWLFGKD